MSIPVRRRRLRLFSLLPAEDVDELVDSVRADRKKPETTKQSRIQKVLSLRRQQRERKQPPPPLRPLGFVVGGGTTQWMFVWAHKAKHLSCRVWEHGCKLGQDLSARAWQHGQRRYRDEIRYRIRILTPGFFVGLKTGNKDLLDHRVTLCSCLNTAGFDAKQMLLQVAVATWLNWWRRNLGIFVCPPLSKGFLGAVYQMAMWNQFNRCVKYFISQWCCNILSEIKGQCEPLFSFQCFLSNNKNQSKTREGKKQKKTKTSSPWPESWSLAEATIW